MIKQNTLVAKPTEVIPADSTSFKSLSPNHKWALRKAPEGLERPINPSYKKCIRPDTKVGLRLTAKERKLILKLMCLDGECEEVVRGTPKGKPILLTLDQWDDFGCYIAAKANRTDRKKRQKKLDAIFAVIEKILNVYTDEEPPLTALNSENDGRDFDGGLDSRADSRTSVATALGTRSSPYLLSEPHQTATEDDPRSCRCEAALVE
jgi:hypothetical protein